MDHPPHIRLPQNATRVLDPDEEIYLLYSSLNPSASSNNGSNLGIVSDRSPSACFRFTVPTPGFALGTSVPTKYSGRHKRLTKGPKAVPLQPIEVEIQIQQNLRSIADAGETGSVVWRSSHRLLEYLLPQLYYPSAPCADEFLLTDPSALRVLELGAGTGLLPVALARFFSRYVCSDQSSCLELLNSNLLKAGLEVEYEDTFESESSVGLQEIDWLETFHSRPAARTLPSCTAIRQLSTPYDLILASDCIYNPHLIKPFLRTLARFAEPNRTVALVVVELRESSVLQELLEEWLSQSSDVGARWELWRLPLGQSLSDQQDIDAVSSSGIVAWLAWRTS